MKKSTVYKGKSRIWTGSIIAALVAATAVFIAMLQMEKNMLSQYEKGSVLVAACEIPKGQVLDEDNYETYLEVREIDVKLIPETAVISPEEVAGLVPHYGIEEGTLVTRGMFEKLDGVTMDMEEPVIAGFKAEDMYQVVGGVLRAGDRIHIYNVCKTEKGIYAESETVVEDENREEMITRLIWQDVFVQEVFDQSGMTITNEDTTTSAQRINVYLDKSDIEMFYSELAEGSLRAVKVCN